MAQAYSPERPSSRALTLQPRVGSAPGALALIFLALCASFTVYRLSPPAAVASAAPANEFSSGRAMRHLEAISRKPHPVGAVEHAAVRDYIFQRLNELGLEPAIQRTTSVSNSGGRLRVAAVENIAGRLRGTEAGKAVLLVAHYDTVPMSPGTSDDGSSVAAILETARALKDGPPLRNSVVFLFTDAEEVGLLGAKAFVEEHPWSREAGLVLNFESRGAGGPAMLFETSGGNRRLVQEFAGAVPRPFATSLAYEVYRRMPNDTDFTVFRGAKLPGLNFANIDGATRYHAQSDSLENFDEGLLQHKGSYALALARHFGNAGLEERTGGDAVYFDLLGATVIEYPAGLVAPITALATLLFAAVLALGLRRRKLTPGGILAGLLALALTAAVAYAAAASVWWLVAGVQRWLGRSTQDDVYHGKLYLVAFVALTLAACAALYNLFRKKISAENLAAGALLCWLLLLVLTTVAVPGGSYLTAWPLIFGLVPLALMLTGPDGGGRPAAGRHMAAALCAVPAVVLLVPIIYQIFLVFGLGLVGVPAALTALLFGLVVPFFAPPASSRNWLLPGGAALAAALLLALAAFTMTFDGRRPKANDVSYVVNSDSGKAVWASTDGQADEWTGQFFGRGSETGSLEGYLPSAYKGFMKSPAPALPLPPPELTVLDDQTANGVRTLRLSLRSGDPAGYVTAPSASNTAVLAATVAGRRFVNDAPRSAQSNNSWVLNYYAPPAEGFELTLEVSPGQPLRLWVVGQSYGLPETPGAPVTPRPDDIMPAPFTSSDIAHVSRTYTF